jgi:xanthine dehydrogenase YagR molybdenum-binding subunit
MTRKSDIAGTAVIGKALDRVDGPLKVRGRAPYTGDVPVKGLTHAVVIQSTIASGTISKIDASAAEALPGVLAVYSHANPAFVIPKPKGGQGKQEKKPLLQDNKVYFYGQIIAVVVAESFEQAQHAASLVQVSYKNAGSETRLDVRSKALVTPAGHDDGGRGDVAGALARAPHKIKATYITPTESHNPMEPFATTAVWEGDALTIYDSTQAISNTQKTLAGVFDIAPAKVRVIAHCVGGGFGCKLSSWSHVTIAAMAAHKLQRPVKLVLGRSQMYGPVGFRPRTVQTVTLGAKQDGTLTAIRHETVSESSKFVEFVESSSSVSLNAYACKNVATSQRIAPLDIGKPTWMRAPGHSPGSFALESAMDELACELNVDPIQLRLANFADSDQESGLPWSSNALKECYRLGAERFGWDKRRPAPGTRAVLKSGTKSLLKSGTKSGITSAGETDGRAGDGLLYGVGMATAVHSVWRNKAQASVRLLPDGTALVQSGTQEIGTGTYTVMSQIAAENLCMDLAKIKFELGDSDLPQAPLSGGSTTAGSVGSAVARASVLALDKLIKTAISDKQSPLFGAEAAKITAAGGMLRLQGATPAIEDSYGAIVSRTREKFIDAKLENVPGDEEKHYAMSTFGAQFAEVAVDPDLGLIHVKRFVGAYSGGRILNAKTAHSQMVGGIIFGIGMCLMEQTIMDHNAGGYVNNNLAEYYVPVNADIPEIDAFFVEENDPHVNLLGVKGIGELGITGVAAAIANAVYNATGKRVRELPITLDKLL